jgi:hypothetical protein
MVGSKVSLSDWIEDQIVRNPITNKSVTAIRRSHADPKIMVPTDHPLMAIAQKVLSQILVANGLKPEEWHLYIKNTLGDLLLPAFLYLC